MTPFQTSSALHADDAETVTDWTGRVRLSSSDVLHRMAEEEALRAFLRNTRRPVRVLGSRLSQTPLLMPAAVDGHILDLGLMQGVQATTPDTVTFGAGTTLDEVHRVLAAMGRMLPCCPGVIARQTLAGALATGTHGQGLGQSSFADTVTAFRIVLADGSLRIVENIDPWFAAVQLSLGSIGIITAVTMRTVQAQVYTCRKRTLKDTLLDDELQCWAKTYDYCKVWWFPEDELVHRWTGGIANPAEAASYVEAGQQVVTLTAPDESLHDAVDRVSYYLRHDTNDHLEARDQFRTLERFRNVSDVTGDLFQIFCNGVAAPQINLEIAIRFCDAGAAIGRIRDWYRETRPRMHYPIILRCTGPSEAWLSPARGEPVCYFGFVVYRAEDGQVSKEGLAFLAGAERLLAGAGGRPHWAKHFTPSLYDWPRLYSHWGDFATVRADADPSGRFLNGFLHDLFGSAA